MKQLVCLLAALCLLTGCAAPAPAGQAPAPSAPETPAPASEAEPPAAPPSDAPVLTCGDYAMTAAQFQRTGEELFTWHWQAANTNDWTTQNYIQCDVGCTGFSENADLWGD